MEALRSQWGHDDTEALAYALHQPLQQAPPTGEDENEQGLMSPPQPLRLPAGVSALSAAMEEAAYGDDYTHNNAHALPLWEAVLLASTLRTLKWRRTRNKWMPWSPYPGSTLGVLVDALPLPPGPLSARGAVMQFRPHTLRARLAQVSGFV